jgi:quinol monooxygenase YgiN
LPAAATAPPPEATGERSALMDAIEIHFQATPLRAQRFLDLYSPAVARVLAYGAKGYAFLRSEEDPDHFTHISYWEDRGDFERYWFSEEMQAVRRGVAGIHGQPVSPHWQIVIARG